MRGWVVLGVTLLLAVSASAATQPTANSTTAVRPIPHEPPIQEFDSPDGTLAVWVADGHGGVALSITDKNKHEVASGGHYPEDRPGGFGFSQGTWTTDSQYFVYSVRAWGDSLKTQPIISIYIYSRRKNTFLSLGSNVGFVASPKFALTPPDLIEIEIADSTTHETKKITLHLSQLAKN